VCFSSFYVVFEESKIFHPQLARRPAGVVLPITKTACGVGVFHYFTSIIRFRKVKNVSPPTLGAAKDGNFRRPTKRLVG